MESTQAITRDPAEHVRRRVRICYFNTWAGPLEEAAAYVGRVPTIDVAARTSHPKDLALVAKARLDCDWYGENARCFAGMQHAQIEFLPAWVCSPLSLVSLAQAPREPREERWLLTMAHQPQILGAQAGKAFELLARVGVRHLFYAFDEASRFMPCFRAIAPHLSVLIHDENPLEPSGRAALPQRCLIQHRSWVANVLPYSIPFQDKPEGKILFLGSQLGLTSHRARQIEFLQRRFGDRFMVFSDHSVPVAQRQRLSRYKVSFCPEGRKFATKAMAASHTDRPFWSGCMGMVPVSEDSRFGGRLEALSDAGLLLRYGHGDLDALAQACERALATGNVERKAIYAHFNQHETIGTVVADAIWRASPRHGT